MTSPNNKPSQEAARDGATAASRQEDTFFLSRGRLLLDAPLAELAGLAEQIIAQAEALGHPQLVPEFSQLRDRANALRAEFQQPNASVATTPTTAPEIPAINAPGKGTRFLLKWLSNPDNLSSPEGPESENIQDAGHLLIVEDEDETQGLVELLLQNTGYRLSFVSDGVKAMEFLKNENVDLVLLDLFLPEMNGYEVIQEMKANPALQNIPIIVISGAGDMDNVVRCVELGAEEFLPKPFNPLLLRTRLAAGVEKKRLREQEQAFLKQLSSEREKSERLLLNVLPAAIAERLKQGEATIAESYPDVTVLFADLANFTQLSEQTPAPKLVELLNEVFSAFDRLAEEHGLEKIKTIGDSYMAVGGLPVPCANHAERVALMALDMREVIDAFNQAHRTQLAIRVGIHSGPVVAGIIGRRKFSYDLWGDTVNLASRMESHGHPGEIQVSETTRRKLGSLFSFVPRGPINVKGKGILSTYFLYRRQALQP